MRYTISSLSFDWGKVRRLANMPAEFGYEIFWECGSEDQWNHTMEILQAECKHPFSIHSPYLFIDLSMPGDTEKLFDELRRPFDLYHRHDGEFYVVHTFDHMNYPHDEAFEQDCRRRSVERLAQFNEICKAEGVHMVAENIAFGNGERWLFTQDQFIDIFRQIPDLDCLVDVGHAELAEMDVYALQEALGSRIRAYHLHDNNGKADSHQRMWMGVRDWDRFAEGVARFTPDAVGVMEYYGFADLQNYIDDSKRLEETVARFSAK